MSAHERARQLWEMAEQLREEAEARGGLDELEAKQIDGLQKWAKHFGRNATEAEIERVGRALGGGAPVAGDGRLNDTPVAHANGHDPGLAFIQSEGFKAICDPTGRPERYSTGLIDVGGSYGGSPYEMKGTLGESASTAVGPAIGGGALVSVPQLVPGTVQKLFQPFVLESLLLSAPVSTSTLRYVVEGTATSGAAGVGEGQLKPESTIGLVTTDEPVKKIATVVPVSDELLEDAPAVQAFVGQRLGLFVNIETERQLLRGTTGGAEVQGLLTGRGVPVYTGGTADTRAEQLFKAMNSMRGSAFVEPECCVVSPSDYQIIRLLKDTANQYLGGGPFMGAYAGLSMAGASNQVTQTQDTLWGKPVFVSATIGAGTALVGSTANACVHNRGGMRIEASNSTDDYFPRNLVAIRAERRLALACYRATGYLEVHFAAGPGG